MLKSGADLSSNPPFTVILHVTLDKSLNLPKFQSSRRLKGYCENQRRKKIKNVRAQQVPTVFSLWGFFFFIPQIFVEHQLCVYLTVHAS